MLRGLAAQPQPLDLQEAAVLQGPGRDVQLGTGHGAGGQRPRSCRNLPTPQPGSKTLLCSSCPCSYPSSCRCPESSAGASALCVCEQSVSAEQSRAGKTLELTL